MSLDGNCTQGVWVQIRRAVDAMTDAEMVEILTDRHRSVGLGRHDEMAETVFDMIRATDMWDPEAELVWIDPDGVWSLPVPDRKHAEATVPADPAQEVVPDWLLERLATGAAQTLHLCAYADLYDDCHSTDRSDEDRPVWKSEWPHAGGGQDWKDHSSPVTTAAQIAGLELIGKVKSDPAWTAWLLAHLDDMEGDLLDRLAHCIAMEALGHGVGTTDFAHEYRYEDVPRLPDVCDVDFRYDVPEEAGLE